MSIELEALHWYLLFLDDKRNKVKHKIYQLSTQSPTTLSSEYVLRVVKESNQPISATRLFVIMQRNGFDFGKYKSYAPGRISAVLSRLASKSLISRVKRGVYE